MAISIKTNKILATVAALGAGMMLLTAPASAAVSQDNIEACKRRSVEEGDVSPATHTFSFQSSSKRKFTIEAKPLKTAGNVSAYTVTCTLKRGKINTVALTKELISTAKFVEK